MSIDVENLWCPSSLISAKSQVIQQFREAASHLMFGGAASLGASSVH
jgi:hypothetical protein